MKAKNEKRLIKGKVHVSLEEQELAISLLQAIAYDNGFFTRWFPEQYAAKWINKVGPIAKCFYDANPELLTDADIEEICSGEETEVTTKYSNLLGFKELHEALNDYFNNH